MTRDILLITVDSLRADHVGYHSNDKNTTPYLEEFAADSHVFTNAFSHACSTRASFPSIMTSTYPRMYGGYERLSEKRTLVSEVLNDNNYETAGFHSNLFLAEEFGYGRGYNSFFDSREDPSLTAKARQFVKDNISQESYLFKALKSAFDATERHTGIEIGSYYVKADDITDMAVEWIDKSNQNRPRFLWVHYMDVHHPYVPPKEYQRIFREEPISDRESIQLRRKMLENPEEITNNELQDIIDLYNSEIRFVDSEVDRLIREVNGAWDDSLILLTADHGEEFREHGRFSHHGTYHDEVIHVPLIVRDGEGSSKIGDVVGLIDIAPTIVDYADSEVPENFYGTSLRSYIHGPNESNYVVGQNFCRTSQWKYILDDGEESLYDLNADPHEQSDISDEYPDVVDRLNDRVIETRKMIDATAEDLGDVKMDDDIQERLRALGYTDQ